MTVPVVISVLKDLLRWFSALSVRLSVKFSRF